MKKISDRTLEEIANLTPDELLNHGVLSLVECKTNEYVCPSCGNGSGENATGITAKTYSDHVGYKCHRCGEVFNNLKICAAAYGLSTSNNFQALVEKICDNFNIRLDYDDDKPIEWTKKKPTTDTAELELIHNDLAADENTLIEFVNQSGGFWRGLPTDLLLKFGCRYIPNWTSPKSRAAKKFSTPTPRLLLPCSNDNYLARLTCSLDDFDNAAQKYIKPKAHAGQKTLFNLDALRHDVAFVVEGEIDAMSIEFAGFHACAVGGADSYKLAVDAIKPLETKPHIVILFDPDDTGRKFAPILQTKLRDVGCSSTFKFLTDEDSKLDVNQILVEQGLDDLRGRLQSILDDAQSDFEYFEKDLFSKNDALFYLTGSLFDLDNAQRLERFCAADVRWITDEERWLIWQKYGVWLKGSDKNSCLYPFTSAFADKLRVNAGHVGEDMKKNARAIACIFRKTDKTNAAITLLKGCDSIRITQNDLDQHPELANTLNGVIDLQTKKLYPAAPELYLTQQISVAYDPRADLSLIDKFFKDIQPDEMTRAGLLRWLGYCLTGSVREEKFLVWLGDGGNGKGTTSKIVSYLLNDYASTMPTATLLKGRPLDADRATTALNGLARARFAISEELPQGAMVDSSLIKNLTGGDLMTVRPLFQEYRKVTPTAKINLSGNFTPRLENFADKGLLRRLLVMPFTVTFDGDNCDSHLKEKLLLPENLRALLRLLVDEAAAWYDNGLIISDAMKTATRENLAENDFIADFLSEYCEVGVGKGEIPRAALLDKLRSKSLQTTRFSDRELCKLIESHGVEYKKTMHGRVFKGIRFLTDDDFVGEPIDKDDIPFDN